MSVKINPVDFLIDTPQSKIDKINEEVPSKLATMFYISKTKRVSYYCINSWGDLVVWNKGANNWEHCPTMLERELYTLPAKGLATEVIQPIKLEESFVVDNEENSLVEVTAVTVEPKIKAQNYLQILSTSPNYNLRDILSLHLPARYFIGNPPSNEVAYTVSFDPLSKTWSVYTRNINDAYLGGTLYTNSWSCIEAAVNYLNDIKATPEQII